MRIEAGSKLLFIGDSVTDCGRVHPVGEGLGAALGNGYVSYVEAVLGAARPEAQLRIVNMGVSGNTVRDLKARWQRDVLELRPDWLSIMIGINDVWRQFDSPTRPEAAVPLDEYERTLMVLVRQALPSVKGLVLMTPFFIEPNRTDAMRTRMDEYGAAVRRIAGETGALLVDTQAAYDVVLEHCYSANISWDRVHPNHVGHMVLARAFLNVVGVPF